MENPQIDGIEERSLLDGILYYISILIQYKALIIVGTFTASVLAVAFSIVSLKLPPEDSPLPNIYRAYAVVLFEDGSGDGGMSSMLSAFGVESISGSSSPSNVAMEILKSRFYIDKIVEKFNLIERFGLTVKIKTHSRLFIIDNSNYSYNQDSGALTISFFSIDPVLASDLVNYQVELLEDWFLNEGSSLRSNELSLMEAKLKELTTEISSIEEKIKFFQSEYGVMDIEEIADAQSSLMTELRTKLKHIELEISDYLVYSTIEDPALTNLKGQKNNILTQIREIEIGYEINDGRRMPSQAELPQLSLDFSHLMADLSLKNQLYQTLSERYEITKLIASESSAFSVLEYAEIPEVKEGPSRGRLCMMVSFGSFSGLIILALFLHLLKNIINDPLKKKIFHGDKDIF